MPKPARCSTTSTPPTTSGAASGRAGVERLSAFPYVAALVAQHALHLFDKYRADPEWAPFFDRMERLRAAHLEAAAPSTDEELRRDYFFVRMADLLSLQFCDDWREPQRIGEFESCWDGTRLTITPDPFGGATVSMSISARRLPNIRFDARAAAAAFAEAPLAHHQRDRRRRGCDMTRVLVVEDDRDIAELVERYLQKAGFSTEVLVVRPRRAEGAWRIGRRTC